MTPKEREAAQMAYAVPLHELLAAVPRDARLVIEDADGKGTRFIPVGRYCHEAAEALRAALAQPEQEPVAYNINGATVHIKPPVYGAAPPQREWVGLTDEEIMKITGVTSADSDWNVTIVHKWIRAIEAKLREKNFDRPS